MCLYIFGVGEKGLIIGIIVSTKLKLVMYVKYYIGDKNQMWLPKRCYIKGSY